MKKEGNSNREKRIETCFACVFFSGSKILEKGVINIWADHNLCQNKFDNLNFIENKAMEAVLSDFVEYVKKNLEEIWEKIVKIGNEDDEEYHIFAAIYAIYKKYWKQKGVNIREVLDLPENIVWSQVVGDCRYEENEIIDEFIAAVRKNISEYYAIPKTRMAPYRENTIFFTDDYIWMPTNIFKKILEQEGIPSYHNEILLLLKEGDEMIAEANGYSRKTIVSKNQFEAYQIRLSIFDKPGAVRLLDLAKEVKEC